MTTQLTRTGPAGTGQPARDKTLTVTITMKVRKGPTRFYEHFAGRIAAQARDLVEHWRDYTDPGQATVEITFGYPQWKHVYGPDNAEEQDQEGRS